MPPLSPDLKYTAPALMLTAAVVMYESADGTHVYTTVNMSDEVPARAVLTAVEDAIEVLQERRQSLLQAAAIAAAKRAGQGTLFGVMFS